MHTVVTRVDTLPDHVAVRVTGEVDIATVARLEAAIDDAFALTPQRLLIDLDQCRFLGGVGLTALVNATRRGALVGTEVMVAAASGGRAHRAITVTGLGEHLALIGYSTTGCALTRV